MLKPHKVGSSTESKVHFMLLVSLYIVITVVEQGKWNKEKSITFIKVIYVHPFWINNVYSIDASDSSHSELPDEYAIIIIGITISFAGNPSMKAISITPSSPKSFANGSRNLEQCSRMVISETVTFAKIQIISPAGAATAADLASTKRVLSKTERTSTFKN